MNKLVSVIIPAYNVEKYIARCLNSACRQTYPYLQIVVIDDGSSDTTFEIIKDFSLNDDRIIAVHKENGGVSSARNLGLSMAEGEYIAFLDSDDELEANAIEVLVGDMEETKADLVSYQFSRWSEDGNRLTDYDFISGNFYLESEDNKLEFVIKELLPYHIGVEVFKLFKKEIITNNNILFPEKCSVGEDFAFVIKYLMNAQKVLCISERLYKHTVRVGSAMERKRSFGQELAERIEMMSDVFDYSLKNHITTFTNKFPVFWVLTINNIFIGHSADEAVENLRTQEKIRFVMESYKNLPAQSDEFFRLDNSEIKKIKYKYHMYIRSSLIGSTGIEKIKLSLYNCYREIKGEEKLEKWKMPY